MNLPTKWYTAGSCDALWGKAGTYKAVPYEALPPLEGPLDGSFDWLGEGAAYGMTHEYATEDVGPHLEQLVAAATHAGLAVPPSFVRFMRDASLHARVPSCTACYWELGARLLPVPGHEEEPGRLLRFMNDQQACLLWYLLLEPGREPRVACAWPDWKSDEESAGAKTLEDMATPAGLAVCAESFEAFIKRFWIENTIWFAENGRRALEGEFAAYSAAVQAARSQL